LLLLFAGSGESHCFAALARCARLYRTPLSLRPRSSCQGGCFAPRWMPQIQGLCPLKSRHPQRGVDARVSARPRMTGTWAGAFRLRRGYGGRVAVAPGSGLGVRPTAGRLGRRLWSGPWAAGRLTQGRCSRLGLNARRAALLDAGSHQCGKTVGSDMISHSRIGRAHTGVCTGWTPRPWEAHTQSSLQRSGGRAS
jgi:hypothetical protein